MKTYIWAIDAGHAWLAVKEKELIELNIQDKITDFSFHKGATVYLEEDSDAATFINAYTAKHGVKPKTKEGKYWIVNLAEASLVMKHLKEQSLLAISHVADT